MKKGILADRLEVWGFEGDFVIFADGSSGFALEVTPIDISCWTPDRINSLLEQVRQFLNGLPEKIDVQFVQEIKSGNDSIINEYDSLGGRIDKDVTRFLHKERVDSFRDLDRKGELPVHKLKVFVRKSLSQDLVPKSKRLYHKEPFHALAEERFEAELKELERLRNEITSGLRALGTEVQEIASEFVLTDMYEQWNPTREIPLGRVDGENVRDSLIFSDIELNKKGFSIFDMEYRILSLKNLPDYTVAGLATQLRRLPFDSKVFLSIHVPNQQEEIENLQTQRRIAYSLVSGSRQGVSDLEGNAKYNDLETLLEEMISQGEKVFYVSLNILLRDKDSERLEGNVSRVLMTLRDMAGSEGLSESLAAFDIFCQVAVPNARCKERRKHLKTSNLADLVPLFGPWSGHKKPGALFRTRFGSLLSYSPFHAGPNANQLISGGSGSGKSYLTNLLILQTLKENPLVFFVDIGGSYEKLCQHLGGQYIPLGVDGQISINPFTLPPGETSPSSHHLKYLVGLVELMVKEEDQTRLPRLVRAEIEKSIKELYSEKPLPVLSDLQVKLLASSEPDVQKIGKILETWCGDTPYGRFVDRPTTVELNNSVIAFDLKGLESFPDLQAVCLYLITNLIWMEIQKDRSRMKYLVFDECWALLKDPAACDFIESVFRTCRKYYTSAIALSQAVDDFAKSRIADAILPNCSVKWVLMQQQSNSESLKSILQLNDSEVDLVKSIRQEKGIFSESFLMAGSDRALVVVEATPIEMWLATTHPADLKLMREYHERFPDLQPFDVLKKLAADYPQGAVV